MRLKKIIFLALAFVLPAAAFGAPTAGKKQPEKPPLGDPHPPYRLEDVAAVRTTPKLPFFVVDMDQDGNDDLLVNEPNGLLWYRLHGNEITLAGRVKYDRPGCTRQVSDANGDGRPDFFVISDTPAGALVSCHAWPSPAEPPSTLFTIGPLTPPLEPIEKAWRRVRIFPSFREAKDASPTIFVGINSQKSDAAPRWIVAFEGTTGREMWRFCMGPQSQDLICEDFGGGFPHVAVTTSAIGNGISCNGTADSLSYLFCLDGHTGDLLWRRQLTGFKGRGVLSAADINGDGNREILVGRYTAKIDTVGPDPSRLWTVAALNGEGEILRTVLLRIRPETIRPVDLDGDSSPEIVVEGTDRDIVILDRDLAIHTIIMPPVPATMAAFRLFGVWDLTRREKRTFVCLLDSMLIVQDRKGEVLAARILRDYTEAQLARYDGENHIVAMAGDTIRVITLEQPPVAARLRAHARRLIIAGAAAVLVAVWALFHVRRVLKRRRERHLTFDQAQNELLTAMAAFGHGGSSLKVLDRLRLHLKNWERIRSDGAARDELIGRLRQTFGETVMPEISHIVMLARRARVPERSWSTLLAEAELAGKELDAIVAPCSEGTSRRDEHVARALAALDAADESIAGIRSHLRSVFRTPVAEALDRLIARFRHEHGPAGAAFTLSAAPPAGAAVFFSPVSFDKIFEALLSNAVRATERKEGAEIAIATREEGNYFQIDVRDNGCGIARDDWERVFDRHYTTKTGEGGFGLYYAREQIARFGGKIFVFDSGADSGTTMRVVLRKSERAGDA